MILHWLAMDDTKKQDFLISHYTMFGAFSSLTFIDLSHRLHSDVPTWKGSCGFSYENKVDYKDGLRAQSLRLHAGVGTHMDAPTHFFEGAASIADIPLEDLIVPMVVLDVNKNMDSDFFLKVQDIKDFEDQYGVIEKGSFVAVNTQWAQYWENPDKYRNVQSDGLMHFPHISAEAAEFLLTRGIVGVGIDTLSPDPDPSTSTTPFPVHHHILGAGKYIVENLANLHLMAPKAHAIILPIPMEDLTESPVRVVGVKGSHV